MNTTHQAQIEEMYAHVIAELQAIGIHNPENPADWIAVPEAHSAEADDNLAADTVESWNERAALVATLERQYNDIMHAKENIKQGTYGLCEVCRQPIEDNRLNANPIARTCTLHKDTTLNV